jgi:hypothetical protein
MDDVVLSMYDTLNSLPDTFLGSVTLPAGAVSTMAPTFVDFDVSSLGITAAVGEQLAFAIKSTGGDTYILPYSTTTFYSGGDPVSRILTQPPSPWMFQPGVTREYGFKTYMEPPGLPNGDFNGDTNWNCTDVNSLVAEIAAGTHGPTFDMTGDGLVNQLDLDAWLVAGGANNPAQTGGNPFLKGDGNLDGVVDGSDFNIWNSRKFTATPAWCSGDFNADGVVDGSDFNIWNSRKFTSSLDNSLLVPEPSLWALFALGLIPLTRWRLALTR